MAHFPRVRAPGTWIVGTLLPAELEQIDAQLFKAANFDDGGTWAPAAAVVVGGAGIRVTSTLDVPAGGFVNFDADEVNLTGNLLDIAAPTVFRSNADPTVDSGCAWTFSSGSSATVASGATLTAASGAVVVLQTHIQSTTIPVTRILIHEIAVGASKKWRLYARHNNAGIGPNAFTDGFEMTLNASWSTGSTQWSADDTAADAYLYEFASVPLTWTSITTFTGAFTPFTMRMKDVTTSAWNADAWDATALSVGIGNPSATSQAIPTNFICSKNVPKAWGRLTTDGAGDVSINDGFGLASAAISGSEILVTLRRAMANTDYSVVLGMCGTSAIPNHTSTVSTTQFRIGFRDFAGGAIDPAVAPARTVNFEVKGEQA